MSKWTEKELNILKTEDNKEKLIKKLPGRSWESIITKKRRLGLGNKRASGWTKEELSVIDMDISIDEMVERLPGRSRGAIRVKLSDRGHKKTLTPRRPWTEEESKSLEFFYPFLSPSELVQKFGRSIEAIRARATKMGLKRDK